MMKHTKNWQQSVSDEDSRLFRQAMTDVTPIKKGQPQSTPISQQSTSPPTKPQPNRQKDIPPPIKHQPLNDLDINDSQIPDQVSAETYLFYSKSPLRPKFKRQLMQGKIQPQAHLDLHDHTLDDAETALSQFIETALMRHQRYLRIIHGKSRGADVPPIKNHVNRWLTVHPKIVAFCSCPSYQGGRGAVNVILSKP